MANQPSSTVLRTFKFRILPRKGQHVRLQTALDHTRDLYNAALEERIGAYRIAGENRSYVTQCKALTELRADAAYSTFPASMQRWPLKKLDAAFAAFFKRVKIGEKSGFPRFKGEGWFKSFGFSEAKGWSVVGRHLSIKGIGRLRLHLHRDLPGSPLACQIKRDSKGWTVLLTCEVPILLACPTGRAIGIDLGITSFYAASDGSIVPGFMRARRDQAEARRRHRALSRCKRGSKNRSKAKRSLARLHERTANARRTFLHQQAAKLVRENDLIAIEDLNIKGLARSVLAREVNDASWGAFALLLIEKAERAGRTVVKVRPHGTSQTCPECGQVKAKKLSQRVHRCDCGCVLDRDVAAAKVILQRAIAGPSLVNVGGCAVRSAGNIGSHRDAIQPLSETTNVNTVILTLTKGTAA